MARLLGNWRRNALALVGSVALHALILLVVARAAPPEPAPRKATPVEMVVVETRPKPPEPPKPPKAEEKAPPPEPKAAAPKPKPPPLAPKDAPKAPPKAEALPPPPNEPPKGATKPAPVQVGLSLSSTTAGGSFAAGVGNTMFGETGSKANDPEKVRPNTDPSNRYVPPHKVATLPKVVHVPVLDYPPEAKKLEIEGTVILQVTIDSTGKVVRTRVLKGLGHGLDEVAMKALRMARFVPGTDGSGPVTTEITYNYIFELTN